MLKVAQQHPYCYSYRLLKLNHILEENGIFLLFVLSEHSTK